MTPAAAASEHTSTDAFASARTRIERQMAMLARLAEIGMEVAEACGRDARAAAAASDDDTTPPSPDHPRDIGLVFARVARAVRMTIALEQRLAGDLADLDRAEARAERSRKDDRRIRLSRLVGQAARAGVEAQRDAGTRRWSGEDAIEAEIERLAYDAYERLIEAEDGDNFDGLSFNAAVATVAKDLGLSPEWTARLSAVVVAPAHPVILGRRPEGPQTRGPNRTAFDEPVGEDGSCWVPESAWAAPTPPDPGPSPPFASSA